MRTLRLIGLFVLLSSSLPAAAQGSPRAGRALWLTGEVPGVWVGPRRMWAPTAGEQALSACGPTGACAPIVERDTCAPPACPGSGAVLVVADDVAAVGAFPRGYGAYTRALEALRADARLAPLHGHLRAHPEEEAVRREERRHEESVRWVSEHRRGDRFELSLHGAFATLADVGGAFAGGTAALGFTFLLDDDHADESDEDDVIANIFFGDSFGLELRIHFLHRVDGGQEAQWIAALGLGPALGNRFETSVVRLPTFFGTILPEVGAILRADRDVTWYVAWSLPFSFLLTHDLALDLTPRVFVIDDWIPKPGPEADDPVEAMFMLSLGVRLP